MAKSFGSAIEVVEMATPSANPPTGTLWLYPKTDDLWYSKSPAGVESPLAGGGGGGAALPPGVVEMYVGAAAPSGYLLCDGSAVSRATFPDLFAVIGTSYGAGDLSTTFNLPDMRDRFPVGVGTGHALGTSDGIAAGASRNGLHDMSHGHGNSGSASSDSAGTPSGSLAGTSAGTPAGTISGESGHTHSTPDHGHGNTFSLSRTTANPGTASGQVIATVNLSGGVSTGGAGTTGGSSGHSHTFAGTSLPSHGHTFTGTTLPSHSHSISTFVSSNNISRLPRLGVNFIIKT